MTEFRAVLLEGLEVAFIVLAGCRGLLFPVLWVRLPLSASSWSLETSSADRVAVSENQPRFGVGFLDRCGK